MIYNELLQSATHSSDYTLASKCNPSHTQNVHRETWGAPSDRCLRRQCPTELSRGETSTAPLPRVSQELSLTLGQHQHPQLVLQGATGRTVSISWSLTHSGFSFPIKMGQNRREKKNTEKRRLNRARKKGGLAGKQEVRAQEEQSDLLYQRHFVRDAFLPAPLFQGSNWGKSCNTTTATPAHPLINISPLHASVFWTKVRDDDLATCLIFNSFTIILSSQRAPCA